MDNTDFQVNSQQTANAYTLALCGKLTHNTASQFWDNVHQINDATTITIDASGLTNCDASGLTAIYTLLQQCNTKNITCSLVQLPRQFEKLWELLSKDKQNDPIIPLEMRINRVQRLGKFITDGALMLKQNVSYIGEILACIFKLIRHPGLLSVRKVFFYMDKIGPDSLPLVILIGILFGVILSFQSAVELKQFGAEIYVANLVAISLFRELGPLLTAIIITGRSASAFAAEISTMKTNEELDALVTMGLDPVPYLVIPRLVAATFIAPLLALLLNIFGMVGCMMVMLGQGYTRDIIFQQMVASISIVDLSVGLIKAAVFGFVVVGIGCIHGLNSGRNAMAVGVSTTSTVVRCIVMITILDGIFTTIFYSLGI